MKGYYNIVTDCLDKHILVNPRKTALKVARESGGSVCLQNFTFQDVYEKTLKLAQSLKQMGLKPGDRVVLRLHNGLSFVSVFMAAIRAGFVPIPTSPLLTQGEFDFILEDSQAALAFIDTDLPVELNKAFKGLPVWVDSSLETPVTDPAASPQPEILMTPAEAPAYWLYTSGTQATPKAVIHAHRSIPAHDQRVGLWQDFREGDVVFNTSALNWSYALTAGWLDIWRHGGCAVTLRGKPHPEVLTQAISKSATTVLMTVPGLYRRLLEAPFLKKEALACVRVALSAGEKLPEEIRRKFLDKTGLLIREGLGMTEHSVFLIQPNDRPLQENSCGRPVHEGAALILREDLSPAEPGETGILASRKDSPGLMLGYHDRPEEMSRVMRGDYFLSGDLAFRDEAGNFYYVGRRDEVITSGGYRISPLEVEAALLKSPLVAEAAAVGVELEPGKTVIRAYLVLKAPPPADFIEGLKTRLEQCLAPYKRPRDFIIVDELPKTSNGKLKRLAL